MPDWKAVVEGHMGGLRLTSAQREEVITEICDHLNDIYAHDLELGVSESEAYKHALQAAGDWRRLPQGVRRTKEKTMTVNDRTKQFWLPMLTCLTLSVGILLFLTTTLGREAYFSRSGVAVFLVTYVGWLVFLPACSAISAWLSRRAGAAPRVLLGAILSPAIVMLGFIACGLLIASRGMRVFAPPQWLNVSKAFLLGVAAPSLALWMGARPFLKARTI